jgi:hypothetical protein
MACLDLKLYSCTFAESAFDELHCLHATYMTSSGPDTPIKVHRIFLHQICCSVSVGAGMLRCIADQTQRPRVKTQDRTRDMVPRPLGFATQPTVAEGLLQFVCAIRTDPLAESERQLEPDMVMLSPATTFQV